VKGKVSVVTGGSSGIGQAIVDKLVASGSTVYNLDIQKPRTDANGVWLLTDITKKESLQKAAANDPGPKNRSI